MGCDILCAQEGVLWKEVTFCQCYETEVEI